MLRNEFILAGCILVAVGTVLLLIGFSNIQDSPLDTAVKIVTQVTGAKVPDTQNSSKSTGYLLIAVGVAAGIAGLGFILNSRSSTEQK